ncbi:MAG: hypothetical protein HQM08_02025 [Candidatus Riflebacteria bacterium]|nr:hypothetical protein [Candidatus Riflebacteria bacterium]
MRLSQANICFILLVASFFFCQGVSSALDLVKLTDGNDLFMDKDSAKFDTGSCGKVMVDVWLYSQVKGNMNPFKHMRFDFLMNALPKIINGEKVDSQYVFPFWNEESILYKAIILSAKDEKLLPDTFKNIITRIDVKES